MSLAKPRRVTNCHRDWLTLDRWKRVMGENDRIALYMPGITLIPQQGTLTTEADQQIEQLRAAIVEIDAQIATLSGA
jgi:hypothetical protein